MPGTKLESSRRAATTFNGWGISSYTKWCCFNSNWFYSMKSLSKCPTRSHKPKDLSLVPQNPLETALKSQTQGDFRAGWPASLTKSMHSRFSERHCRWLRELRRLSHQSEDLWSTPGTHGNMKGENPLHKAYALSSKCIPWNTCLHTACICIQY